MESLTILALFVLGAIVASFAGVVAERLHTGQSFWRGRSRCDACGETLSPLALVPVVSYLLLGGRASCCGTRLSSEGPLTECLLGTLFVITYLQLGWSVALPFFLFSLGTLLALVRYDLAHQILPPPLLITFVISSAGTGYFLAPSLSVFYSSSVVAILVAGSLALIHFLSGGRAMGFADAPLSFGLALLTGHAALPGFVFSFWIGAVVGIALLFNRPPGSRMGVEVPFAPYLAAGFLLAYFTQWNPFVLLI